MLTNAFLDHDAHHKLHRVESGPIDLLGDPRHRPRFHV